MTTKQPTFLLNKADSESEMTFSFQQMSYNEELAWLGQKKIPKSCRNNTYGKKSEKFPQKAFGVNHQQPSITRNLTNPSKDQKVNQCTSGEIESKLLQHTAAQLLKRIDDQEELLISRLGNYTSSTTSEEVSDSIEISTPSLPPILELDDPPFTHHRSDHRSDVRQARVNHAILNSRIMTLIQRPSIRQTLNASTTTSVLSLLEDSDWLQQILQKELEHSTSS